MNKININPIPSPEISIPYHIFNQVLTCTGLVVPPKYIHQIIKSPVGPYVIKNTKIQAVLQYPPDSVYSGVKFCNPRKKVYDNPNIPPLPKFPPSSFSNPKIILLDPSVNLDSISDEAKQYLKNLGPNVSSVQHTLFLDYDHFSYEYCINRILPEKARPGPSSFETAGTLAHLNLREHHLPFKYTIGAVLLDKSPYITTVVNKVGTITNEFRVFQMELLAGEHNLNVKLLEHGCRFEFDFSKVYWNSRLEKEHSRQVEDLTSGEVIADMMCGIGPFAIPAAKLKGCTVYANDKNPNSYQFLNHNIDLNNVSRNVHSFEMDGKLFIEKLISGDVQHIPGPTVKRMKKRKYSHPKASTSTAQHIDQPDDGGPVPFTSVFMNLPASAPTFLSVFTGGWKMWKNTLQEAKIPIPTIHCYTFSKSDEENTLEDGKKQVIQGLGIGDPLYSHIVANLEINVRIVRKVAPTKFMLCCSFPLTKQLMMLEFV